MRPALQLRLGQQLLLTPQLQQALKLLAMPQAQLLATLEHALDSNVMLEAQDGALATDPAAGAEPLADLELDGTEPDGAEPAVDADWDSLEPEGSWEARGAAPGLEVDAAVETGLRAHLLGQLAECRFSARDGELALALLDALDEHGYLDEPVAALAAELDAEPAEVEAVRHRLQRLDPVGTCSTDLADCLGVQLAELDPTTPALAVARTLVADHIARIGRSAPAELARALGVAAGEVEAALKLVRGLNPRPAASLPSGATEYVRPDARVLRRDGRWVVELDLGALPSLRVNAAYARALAAAPRTAAGRGANADLRAQLDEARWLVKGLAMRNATLLRVATAVVERQVAFLERGPEALRPLSLREVAGALELHESTVSRVTGGKWLLTPRGMFELRRFFSNQVAAEGADVSASAVRAMIQRLVAEEDARRPLSDAALVQALARRGIRLARRTVTKYREALAIPASYERRQGA